MADEEFFSIQYSMRLTILLIGNLVASVADIGAMIFVCVLQDISELAWLHARRPIY